MSSTIGVLTYKDIRLELYSGQRCYFWKVTTPDPEENINSIQLTGDPFYTHMALLDSAHTYMNGLINRLYKNDNVSRQS